MTLVSVSAAAKNEGKQAKRPKVTHTRSDKTMTDPKTLSGLILPRGTSPISVCGEGRGGVEGLPLNGMVMSRSDLVDAFCSDSLVVSVCDPPAPAAGHICRHDGSAGALLLLLPTPL